MTDTPFEPVPADPGAVKEPPPELTPIVATYTTLIQLGLSTTERNLSRIVGPSQIGHPCDRHLVYLMGDVPVVNHTDPMKLIAGIGIHSNLAQIFTHLDRGSGRFLVEERVSYRNCTGTCDLFDQFTHTLIDWKTCSKARLAKYIKDGPPVQYRVQVQLYAAGLQAAGHQVDRIALFFLPHDGALAQSWAWETTPDRSVADAAIDRLASLRDADPVQVPMVPDRYCAYCDHYNPRVTDLRIGCPGPNTGRRK